MEPRAIPETDLQSWVGREETAHDTLDLRPARLMHSILPAGGPCDEGCSLPPLWHWLYFPVAAPLDQLGPDGHPARGGFLPPVALPRRMWAGGRFTFESDLRLGEMAVKRSRILKVTSKDGSSGPLCFVTVEHVVSVGGEARLREEHDIVYRGEPRQGVAPARVPEIDLQATVSETVYPSAVMLFRYSAITFNGHRIHYDRDYCRDIEGYPGLVFHGPLTATLLADLAVRRSGRSLASFSFRAVSPLFDTAPFTIAARESDANTLELWAEAEDGGLAMRAQARLR